MGCCILGIIFSAAFSLIFPLIGPPIVILLILTLVAHRYLVSYVYGRINGSHTGALLDIWLVRRFGDLLALQPFLLGLIFLSYSLWALGSILIATGVIVLVSVETFASRKLRQPKPKSLSSVTQSSLEVFTKQAKPGRKRAEEESSSLVSSSRRKPSNRRGSFASVLEMMSATLALMPSQARVQGPIPLPTDELDDLVATERAARTHPDAPPHLPQLPFTDYAEEMAGILYPPELIAPPPIIWLPNDPNGVARSEAYDLQRYHGLHATIDVKSPSDVVPTVRASSRDGHGGGTT